MLEQYLPEQRFLFWDDTQLEPGVRFQEEILRAIEAAKIAVLLVSSRFCKSEFVREIELPELCKAADRGLRVSWFAIDDCVFELASKFHAIYAPSHPLAGMKDARLQLLAIHEICRKLQEAF